MEYEEERLTPELVLARTRASDLESVKKLNFWGSDITDISVVRQMPNLEICSVSVNSITTLKDFSYCPNLQELYIRKNKIEDLSEINHLTELSKLRNLWLADNPCATGEDYRATVLKTLPNLQKLDNKVVTEKELEALTGRLDLSTESLGSEEAAEGENEKVKGGEGETTSENQDMEVTEGQDTDPEVTGEKDPVANGSEDRTSPVPGKSSDGSRPKLKPANSLLDPVTLSWEETNKIRQELGLKPLPFEKMTSPKSVPSTADKSRNAHVLQAVLILIRELDNPSLEIVESAVQRKLHPKT